MADQMLAQIVREVLAEELARLRKTKRGTAEAGASREITVTVADPLPAGIVTK